MSSSCKLNLNKLEVLLVLKAPVGIFWFLVQDENNSSLDFWFFWFPGVLICFCCVLFFRVGLENFPILPVTICFPFCQTPVQVGVLTLLSLGNNNHNHNNHNNHNDPHQNLQSRIGGVGSLSRKSESGV